MNRPNIIMLMTDQQRWDAMGCVQPFVVTPAIDSLAREGVFFDQAVCQCPMCVPSRNSFMFGMYPSQTGVRTNRGALLDESRLPAVPLPQLMHDAGYFCAGFGKAHWNHARPGEMGSRRGFDVRAEGQSRSSILCEEGAVMMDDEDPEGLKAYYDETREFGAGEENALGYIGKPSKLPIAHHRDGFIHKKCVEFLESYEPDGRPLFLYFSLIKPHAGFNIPPQFEAMYDLGGIPDIPAPPWAQEPDTHIAAAMKASLSLHDVHYNRKAVLQNRSPEEKRLTTLRYYANCTFMDALIGDVLRVVREKGLDRNTLFVFLSDHGEMLGERDGRFSKYCLFDSSVRVPLILAGDYVAKALHGTRDSRPAMLTDLVPTLCAAAGIMPDPRLPGVDLLGPWQRRAAFCEFHGCGTERVQPAPALMWRNQAYKLILFRDGTVLDDTPMRGELYDLKNDPHEWRNLYGDPAYAPLRSQMTLELLSHLATAFAKGPAFGDYRGLEPLVFPE
ncbi:MAG: sulfatase-like hydrolase/transferase [Clostridia bacterium]|nr:sulfatase-like hydrolase/transferase [Clostridia bacterium]